MSELARGPEEPDEVRVRASDAEREQVAEIVRRAVADGRLTLVEGDERMAAAYGATHRGELVGVTADLEPVPGPGRAPAPAVARPDSTVSVAIMSESERRGEWTPGLHHRALAVMGGVELDLRHARFGDAGLTIDALALMGGVEIDLRGAVTPAGVTIRAVAIMGGVEVVVDEDTVVDEAGLGIMGGFVDDSGAPAGPGGPTVRVTGLAFMGGVTITRKPRELEG